MFFIFIVILVHSIYSSTLLLYYFLNIFVVLYSLLLHLISILYYSNYKEDVWMKVVEILSYNQDVAFSFSLRLVCKKWENIFSNLTLNEATILNSNSLNWYLLMNLNIQFLFILDVKFSSTKVYYSICNTHSHFSIDLIYF
jgi:hypothetical protein